VVARQTSFLQILEDSGRRIHPCGPIDLPNAGPRHRSNKHFMKMTG
jgi:hypothetical protein